MLCAEDKIEPVRLIKRLNAEGIVEEIYASNCPRCQKSRECPLPSGERDTGLFGLIKLGMAMPCESCAEAERVKRLGQQRQEEIAQRRAEWNRICPPMYLKFDAALLPQSAKGKLEEVLRWRPRKRGLIIKGQTGKGKSFLAYALAGKLFIELGVRVQVFDCLDFAHRYGRLSAEYRADEWMDGLAESPLLFFDDFGKLKMTDRIEAELFGLIERRMSHERPLVMTTNDTSETLAARMTPDRGEPFVRRLREWCDVVTVG